MMSLSEPQTPRRTRAFWQKHTDQWKHSGLSKIAYCQQHNLKPASFYNWSKKLEHVESELTPNGVESPMSLLPVQIESSMMRTSHTTSIVHVERAGTQIALPTDLTGDQIQHWLQAIHALHV